MPRVPPIYVPFVFILGGLGLLVNFMMIQPYYDLGIEGLPLKGPWIGSFWSKAITLLPFGVAYYLLGDPPYDESTTGADTLASDANGLPSFLIPSYTTHARLLPTPSRHAFSYPLLYLAVDIDQLDTGKLGIPGRVFNHGGKPWTKILGLRSRNYLKEGEQSFRTKLEDLLADQDVEPSGIVGEDQENQEGDVTDDMMGEKGSGDKADSRGLGGKLKIGRVWLITMPSFLGFEGINPLSVWYVYDLDGILSTVVLEVHNTFGEKHAYALRVSSSLAHEPKEGYSHAWTFPRSFHVSPFNSRDGFYRLDILNPFPQQPSTSNAATTPHLSTPAKPETLEPNPEIKVYLRLLTPSKETKLTALLASSLTTPSIPLTRSNTSAILSATVKWPLSLLLTTPRILYEAYKLHYLKRLAVYPRPEPKYKGAEGEWNAPEGDEGGIGRAVGWQVQSWGERTGRRVVEQWLTTRIAGLEGLGVKGSGGVRIEVLDDRPTVGIRANTDTAALEKADQARGGLGGVGKEDETLVIRTADPKFFTNLIIAPSAAHYLTLAPELLTTVSSPSLFTKIFSTSTPASRLVPSSVVSRITHRVRWTYTYHLFAHSRTAPTPDLVLKPARHWLDAQPKDIGDNEHAGISKASIKNALSLWDCLQVLFAVVAFYLAEIIEEWLMRQAGAKFVEGREPWRMFERAMLRRYKAAELGRSGHKYPALSSVSESELVIPAQDRANSRASSRNGDEDGWVDLGSIRYD